MMHRLNVPLKRRRASSVGYYLIAFGTKSKERRRREVKVNWTLGSGMLVASGSRKRIRERERRKRNSYREMQIMLPLFETNY